MESLTLMKWKLWTILQMATAMVSVSVLIQTGAAHFGIGEKEYGNTVIVQDDTGLEIWYSNINIGNITIYDYVKKGDYLGEAIDNKLIMIFKKDGEVEDYNKYI